MRSTSFRRKAIIGAAILAAAAVPATGPAAQAVDSGAEVPVVRETSTSALRGGIMRPLGVPFTEYKMVDRKRVSSQYTNLSQLLAMCRASSGVCTTDESKSATRTIGLALGATRSWAAGQLSISTAASRTLSISCTSPRLKAGQVWKAYPLGVRWSYKIRSQ